MIKPYAAVFCRVHGSVDIDEAEYTRQMRRPNSPWTCPTCYLSAEFDDERFEEIHDATNGSVQEA